ncbi:MAG: glycoside hydrolase domain-containing protein [Sporolactobacillus sp.]
MLKKWIIRFARLMLCTLLIVPALPAHHACASGSAHGSTFYTSFENGQPAPASAASVFHDQKGRSDSSGITSTVNGATKTGMSTVVGKGPGQIASSRSGFGFTGNNVLYYAGQIRGGKDSYSVNRLTNVQLSVTPQTQLSYYIAPLSSASTSVSVDLAFSDGTYLHSFKQLTDEDGIAPTAAAQGVSGTLLVNQWNHKIFRIGEVAAGKTITSILLTYQATAASGNFKGALDNLSISDEQPETDLTPVERVNILRGTDSSNQLARGSVEPAVGVPNGFAYWSPATNASSANTFYPYQKNNDPSNDPTIQAFSLSHSPNSEGIDRQSFQVMPSDFAGTPSASRVARGLPFKRSSEIARPDLYQVTFNNGIKAEMTALSHTAMLRFTFKGNTGNLIFDNIDNNGSLKLMNDAQTIEGYSDVRNAETGALNRLYFFGTVDAPVIDGEGLYADGRSKVSGFYKFNTSVNKTVTLRIASSLIGISQAEKNLDLEAGTSVSFEQMQAEAAESWNDRLSRVTVEGASDAQQTTLYSNLYRTYLYPTVLSENTGSADSPVYQYADLNSALQSTNTPTQSGAILQSGMSYALSDFRYSAATTWSVYELLEPTLTGTILADYLRKLSAEATLLAPDEVPYADLVFADALMKNTPGLDPLTIYNRLLQDASVNRLSASSSARSNDSLLIARTVPSEKQEISDMLTLYTRDAALASLAQHLSTANQAGSFVDDAAYFTQQAQNYTRLFSSSDSLSGDTGAVSPFKTAESSFADRLVQKKNSQLLFNVPQDGQGLANMYGGRAALATHLNAWFSDKPVRTQIDSAADFQEAQSGGVGLFSFAAPAASELPYMFLFTDQPWRTQYLTRQLLNRFYTGADCGGGYIGSDTGAQLSSFYFFAAAGFFPLRKGSSDYVLNVPFFKQMSLHFENGRTLTINAPSVSNRNLYVQSVLFNGKPYLKTMLSQQALMSGGTLSFVTGKSHATSDLLQPPSSFTAVKTDGATFYPHALSDLLRSSRNLSDVSGLVRSQDGNAFISSASSAPQLEADFATHPAFVKFYTLTSSGSGGVSDPKSWTLYGSDDDRTWQAIDVRQNEGFAWRMMTRAFQIHAPQPWKYYKLEITDNSSADPLAIGNMQLLGYADVTDDFDRMTQLIIYQFMHNNLSEDRTTALLAAINEAENTYRSNNMIGAISGLQTYLRLLHSFAYQVNTPLQVDAKLGAEGEALIDLLSN